MNSYYILLMIVFEMKYSHLLFQRVHGDCKGRYAEVLPFVKTPMNELGFFLVLCKQNEL